MSWNLKRQLVIFLIVIGIFVVASFFIFDFKSEATCFDGKKNGDEAGIDCGGSCVLACSSEAKSLIVRFARPFEAAPGVYNAVAAVENPNDKEGVFEIGYEFRLYDDQDILVAERTGKTFIPANQKIIILEPNLITNTRIATKAAFRFLGFPQWVKIDPRFINLGLKVENEKIEAGQTPKISATLRNDSSYDLTNVTVAVLVYDKENNVITASQTIVPSITRREAAPILWSWNKSFEREVVRIEILPKVDVFNLGS